MGVKFLKAAVIYFLIGVAFGLYMEMADQQQYTGVHAHVNLLGWVSMGIAGLIYVLFPKAGESALAKAHFWLHNIGTPIMMIALFLLLYLEKDMPYGPIIGVGAILIILGVLLFAINVLKNVKAKDASQLYEAAKRNFTA